MPFKKSLTHSTRVLRLRLKDKHAAALSAMARDVNFVWNYANDLSFKVHAKIGNRRKDFLHKLSTRLVAEHGAIFIGDVNASGLAQTRMAKSVLDAGWSMFRTMLHYKSDDAGVWFEEVNEAYSTQTCSACDARSGPRGLQGLGIREWSCSNCGAVHDRDVNSANIILARGHARLAGGIPFLSA